MLPQSKTVPLFEGLTMASAGTVAGGVDTIGFDFCEIDLVAGTGETASTALAALHLMESDTVTAATDFTDYTDGSPITQFVGAAAISTSAGFVLPALSSSVQNSYRFNIDLKGRMRYIGLELGVEKQTVGVSCTARLSRVADGVDASRILGTATIGQRLVVNG